MSIRITGIASNMDTDSMVNELVNVYKKKGEKYTKAQTKNEWKQEAWKNLNTKIKNFYSKYASEMRFSTSYNAKSTSISDPSKVSIVTDNNAINGTQTLKVSQLAKTAYLTGAEISVNGAGGSTSKASSATTMAELGITETKTVKIGIGQPDDEGNFSSYKSFEVRSDMTVADVTKCLGSNFNANFDSATGRIYMSAKESGAANEFTFVDDTSVADALGLTAAKGGIRVAAQDSIIELNNVTYTSSSNTHTVNGLTITAKDETTGNGISITTDVDYDSIYNKVKDFFKEYNSLINEIDKMYNASSSKGYEPLTDEEKDAMSDSEIEKWETKIKDSLLRYDSDLDTVASAMKNAMLQGYEINGKQYSLSSFGINTLSYFESADFEKNALHIDGDSDDSYTSGNKDRLKAMIASNPEDTAEFFQKLTDGLYKAMNKIQSHSDNYTSYGAFYSDKKLKSEGEEQSSQVKKWEDYVKKIEDKYYKQFSAMESSLTKLNSQQSYLSSLFGGGQ